MDRNNQLFLSTLNNVSPQPRTSFINSVSKDAGKNVNIGIVFDKPSAVTTDVAVFPVPNP